MHNILFLLIFCLFSVGAFAEDVSFQGDEKSPFPVSMEQVISQCESGGGNWETFANACADSCYLIGAKKPVCSAVLKKSCNCGTGHCWDSGQIACRDNTLYEKNSEPEREVPEHTQ